MKNKETIKHIKSILSKLPVINKTRFTKNPPEVIIFEICDFYGVNFEEIRGKTRKREYIEPRQVISYFIRKYTRKEKPSYDGKRENILITNQDIAAIVNKKRHATILHSIKVVENQINTDKNFKANIDLMDKKIQTYEQTV